MRLKINFTPNKEKIPLKDIQKCVNRYIHGCLGDNNKYHDNKSDYCISHLQGGRIQHINDKNLETYINFPNGSYLTISSNDQDFLGKIIEGITNQGEEIGYGIKFKNITHINENFYDGWNKFHTLSPFIIKDNYSKGKYCFITLNDDNFEKQVEDYLYNKLLKIIENKNLNLKLDEFKVHIPNHENHKVKRVFIKNIVNYANKCDVHVKCSKEVAELIYNIGLGQSTGSGFGTLHKVENYDLYKI